MKETNNKSFLSWSLLVVILLTLVQCKSAVSPDWALAPFTKVDSVNPILGPGKNEFICPLLDTKVMWDEKDVFNPAAVVRNGKVYLLFRAEDTIGKHAGTSRIGLAVSDDGLHFIKATEPVLFPDQDEMKIYEWEGGIEDPRVVETEDSTFVMTYTAYDGVLARLCIATSKDLRHWTKRGLALPGKYTDTWSKSGAIVARQTGDRFVAHKIDNQYYMYWGDTDLFLATSNDLIHWSPVEEGGKPKSILRPRPGYFDSRLVESGPFALFGENGILLIYNGMNQDTDGDPDIAAGAYSAGQVLFDKDDPSRLVGRLEKNFLSPDRPYEITGQVNQVCFVEGMVHFKNHWYLYYGTADSKIGVAIY